MNTRVSFLVLSLALAVASGNSHAQDLESYKKKYQDALDKITADHAQQVENITKTYSAGLNTLKERVQAAGDLNKLKAVLAELSRFEKDQTFPTEEAKPIPEVLALVKDCQGKITQAVQTKARRIIALASQYDKALLRLQQESTRKGELDKATAIQEERKILAETETLTAARALLAKASKAKQKQPSASVRKPKAEQTTKTMSVVGVWRKTDTGTVFDIRSDGTVVAPHAQKGKYKSGKWVLDGKSLTLIYDGEKIHMTVSSEDALVGRWTFQRKK